MSVAPSYLPFLLQINHKSRSLTGLPPFLFHRPKLFLVSFPFSFFDLLFSGYFVFIISSLQHHHYSISIGRRSICNPRFACPSVCRLQRPVVTAPPRVAVASSVHCGCSRYEPAAGQVSACCWWMEQNLVCPSLLPSERLSLPLSCFFSHKISLSSRVADRRRGLKVWPVFVLCAVAQRKKKSH